MKLNRPASYFPAIAGRKLPPLLCPLDSGQYLSEYSKQNRLILETNIPYYRHSSVFGVVLILVDIVLVIVDISLPARSREVGNTLETVSLIISFFFLADVLLRIYVEG